MSPMFFCNYAAYYLKIDTKCIGLEINSRTNRVSQTLKFEQEGDTVVLDVRGLIYHGDFHFTSHIIGTDGIVWYHDGMTIGSSCENVGDFDKFFSRNLLKCKGKKLILVVYLIIGEGGDGNGCVGGCILYLFSSAIQMACVNVHLFEVENNIRNILC